MTALTEDDIALAGEYVLGLLDHASQVSVAARITGDADFATEVEAWQTRLQPILDAGDALPPASVWSAIKAGLPQPTGQDTGNAAVRMWQGIAGLSTMAAAVLGIILLQQPEPLAAPVPPAPLIAALGSETGTASLTARYDSANGTLLLVPVSLDTGQLYPELWVVPADGQARSLGVIRRDAASEVVITPEMRGFMGAGATLAITPEAISGGPGGKPTGPIIASGKITTV